MAAKTVAGIATCFISSSGFLPSLSTLGRPLAIIFALHYMVRMVLLLAAGAVAMSTKDDKRRKASVEIARAICRSSSRAPRLPGG